MFCAGPERRHSALGRALWGPSGARRASEFLHGASPILSGRALPRRRFYITGFLDQLMVDYVKKYDGAAGVYQNGNFLNTRKQP